MRINKIIFIGGIHGIGKTTVCNKLADVFNIPHYSSSSLIKNYLQSDFLPNKRTQEIQTNQDILLKALSANVQTDKDYLLDGHFCLLDKLGEVTQVPFSTFKGISPSAMIVLKDSPSSIAERIQNRDRHNHSIEFLSEFQDWELSYSHEVAERLNVPLICANPFNELEILTEFIKTHIR